MGFRRLDHGSQVTHSGWGDGYLPISASHPLLDVHIGGCCILYAQLLTPYMCLTLPVPLTQIMTLRPHYIL